MTDVVSLPLICFSIVPRGTMKGKSEMRKSSVKMDDKMQAFLYGSKYIEEVVLRKMYNVAVKEAKRLIFEERVPVMVK